MEASLTLSPLTCSARCQWFFFAWQRQGIQSSLSCLSKEYTAGNCYFVQSMSHLFTSVEFFSLELQFKNASDNSYVLFNVLVAVLETGYSGRAMGDE